jgi:hypothetical protein
MAAPGSRRTALAILAALAAAGAGAYLVLGRAPGPESGGSVASERSGEPVAEDEHPSRLKAAAEAERTDETMAAVAALHDEASAARKVKRRLLDVVANDEMGGPAYDEALAEMKPEDLPAVVREYRTLPAGEHEKRSALVMAVARVPSETATAFLTEVVTAELDGREDLNELAALPEEDRQLPGVESSYLLPEILAVEGLGEIAARSPASKPEIRVALEKALHQNPPYALASRIRAELSALQ